MPKQKIYVSYDPADRLSYSLLKSWFDNDALVDICNNLTVSSIKVTPHEERISKSSCYIILISEATKNLSSFLQAELDYAILTDKPIIAVNLNNLRSCDTNLCPFSIQTHLSLHVPFNLSIIRHAIERWPADYEQFKGEKKWPMYFNDSVYVKLGIKNE